MSNFEVIGFEELQEDLKKAIDFYPDKAQSVLEKQGRDFKKRVKEIAGNATKEHTGNLTKGFKVTKAKGFREDMTVDFIAESGKKNPHWHLVENGHEEWIGGNRKSRGRHIGFVPGKHMVKKAKLEFKTILPIAMEEMRDDILRGSGLD